MTSRRAGKNEQTEQKYEHGGYVVGVGGGRDFNNKDWLYSVLDQYHDKFYITEIVSGGAKGADTLAEQWAKDKQITKLTIYIAQWELYGKSAGPARNKLIVANVDVFMAFPTEQSKGTHDAINQARMRDIPVYVFGPERDRFAKYIP